MTDIVLFFFFNNNKLDSVYCIQLSESEHNYYWTRQVINLESSSNPNLTFSSSTVILGQPIFIESNSTQTLYQHTNQFNIPNEKYTFSYCGPVIYTFIALF